MASAVTQPRLTWPEYLELERTSSEKHEYLRGEVWAMAGGTPEHGRLSLRIGRLLGNALERRRCNVYPSDVRVRVRATDRATYPDSFVVCDRVEYDPDDQNTIINPTVIVEVLSPGTEASDRGEKFSHYQRLASLKEYVLVSQDTKRLEVFVRASDTSWLMTHYEAGAKVTLTSIGVTLDVDEVYFDPMGPTSTG